MQLFVHLLIAAYQLELPDLKSLQEQCSSEFQYRGLRRSERNYFHFTSSKPVQGWYHDVRQNTNKVN